MMFQQDTSAKDTARLEDYLKAIRLHWLVVVGCTAALLVLAWLVSNAQVASYEAEAQVVLYPTPVGSVNANSVNPNLDKESVVLASTQTAGDAATTLGFGGSPEDLLADVRVTFVLGSDVLDIAVTNTDPELATARVNAFADAYVAEREGQAVAFYEAIQDSANQDIDALKKAQADTETENDQIDLERTSLFRTQPASESRDDTVLALNERQATLRIDAASFRNQITTLTNTSRNASTSLDTRTATAAVIRRAVVPDAPVGLSRNVMLLAGGFLGLLLGIVVAFLIERLDTTARDDEDVALALGTRVIGGIPTLGMRQRSGPSSLVMLGATKSGRSAVAVESFRRLRSAVQFIGRDKGVATVIVTSASPAEGKSLVSANLALAVAQGGSRVVLVSADMRRPTQEDRFGIGNTGDGLSNYLGKADAVSADDLTTIEVPGVENLWILPAGPMPANPGELLGSSRFEELMKLLVSEVDLVIVDTPPILSTADALAAVSHVDGVIVVVDTKRTETTDLLQVRADLERSGAEVLGAVMNRKRTRVNRIYNRDRYTYVSK